MIDMNKVLGALQLPGAATAAVAELVHAIIPIVHETDQDKLKAELEHARARSDQAHDATQAAGRGEA